MSRHLNWTFLALLTSLAAAQSTPPAVLPVDAPSTALPAACPPDESFVEVRVAGRSRGGYWLRTGAADQRTWLQRSAIRSGEEAYFDAQLTCDDIDLVRLRSELPLKIDPEQLTLSFDPLPQLLSTGTLALAVPPVPRLPSIPLFNLEYHFGASGNVLAGAFRGAQFDTRAEYLKGNFSSFIGIRQLYTTTLQSGPLGLYSRVRYQPSGDRYAQLIYNLPSTLNFWSGPLQGAQGMIRGGNVRYWPSLSFVLPLGSDVRVSVDGTELAHAQVVPGTITLHDIPLRQSKGSILVSIEDETGTRFISQDYSYAPELLAPGGYTVTAEGGALAGQAYVGSALQYGLTPSVTVEAEAGLKAGQGIANAWVVLAPPQQHLRFGVGIDTTGSAPVTALKAQYIFITGAFNVGLSTQVPLGDLSGTQVDAALRYASAPLNVNLSGGYNLALNGWYAQVDGSVRAGPHLNVLPFAAVTTRGSRFGVGVSWTPQPNIQAQAGVSGSPGNPLGFGAAISDQLTPSSRVSASTDLRNLALDYQFRGHTEVEVGASTSGNVNAQLQGRATLVAGKLSFSANKGSRRFVLLKTGIPDLGISAEGAYQGRTNAAGDLVLSLESGSGSQVQLDLTTLPIEIAVESETLNLTLPTEGATVIDWRENFTRSRFVTFGLDAQHLAAGGQVRWDGQDPIDLDDQGEGLLPVLNQFVTGTLTFADGRECAVRISTASQVFCTPAAP
ncbi:hypothetical protein EHF33_14610 [Deinococcus psychrotolerans]|uniref:Fimbrial biogenesis outer membrane usher protein n=1 Tax=Deinococcus psychrotolerans TaxID=2489213 RepID=A0A3G8YND6_9DEIO|nr:hypothetical protein [Deinococcus psychrotolerans]AZI44134.1 hypothetical protein EHF33_14610 [Deinococcus psychrotolerans]